MFCISRFLSVSGERVRKEKAEPASSWTLWDWPGSLLQTLIMLLSALGSAVSLVMACSSDAANELFTECSQELLGSCFHCAELSIFFCSIFIFFFLFSFIFLREKDQSSGSFSLLRHFVLFFFDHCLCGKTFVSILDIGPCPSRY